jgi:uncharacterized protein YjiS (DUF1127 family)
MTMNIARSITEWRRYRETVTELNRLSTRDLNDLGIGRADIRSIARQAARV